MGLRGWGVGLTAARVSRSACPTIGKCASTTCKVDTPERVDRPKVDKPVHFSLNILHEREFVIDNLLVRIHFLIEMIWWIGLAPWEFEVPLPGNFKFTFLEPPAKFTDPSNLERLTNESTLVKRLRLSHLARTLGIQPRVG